MEKMWIFQSGRVYGAFYTVREGLDTPPIYRNAELWRDDLRDADGGLTRVRVIITKDTAGRVDASWQHEDPTRGKMPIAEYDLTYQETIGFWESVKDHIQMLESGDVPGECLGLGYGWQE